MNVVMQYNVVRQNTEIVDADVIPDDNIFRTVNNGPVADLNIFSDRLETDFTYFFLC